MIEDRVGEIQERVSAVKQQIKERISAVQQQIKEGTPKTYSACNTEDLREVLEHISRKYPEFPIYGVGISLGGIILGHYLAESKSRSTISAAFLISVAFDIHAGEASLSIPGLNLMLNKYLTQRLCTVIKPHKQMFRSVNIDVDYVLKSKTVRDFDERFTSRIFKYKNVDEYYAAATLKSKITQIDVPVLCLNAADDIFCPLTALPCDEVLHKRNIALVISSRGGHIGFMDGIYPAPPFFSERLFKQYLQGLLSVNVNQTNKSMFL
ncbi:phospholipase ABHD3-like [Stegodyphus dumicola]|uniref:phospholipase ABHD3-like n=1 Tax=Stegodyphus dumicola TaxID=202533 RepID=UPI0015A94972|nr:phospholipase ABHD3-like [Stegodyphus dumicola]